MKNLKKKQKTSVAYNLLRHGRSGKHRTATFPLAQKPPRSDTRETDVTAINFVSQQQER